MRKFFMNESITLSFWAILFSLVLTFAAFTEDE